MLDTTGHRTPMSRPLLVCFSHLRWDFVFQRPQHLLTRAAAEYAVVFWEEPEYPEGQETPGLRCRIAYPDIVIATPLLPRGLGETATDVAQRLLLGEFLQARGEPVSVAWFYTPMALAFAHAVSADVTVYDCMDELSMFAGASPRLLLLEKRLLRQADLVFTGGRSLQEAKQGKHRAVHCFPSAVDTSHFGTARTGTLPDPDDQAAIPHPRIGFFGVLDERLDAPLLARMAALRPDWHFVLIGPTAKISPEELPRAANIHWLGGKSYAQLPAYLAHWDAGFMPFALNDATRYISPTKTPEYLAAGVRLGSTAVRDVARDWGESGLVSVAADAAAAVADLAAMMAAPRAPWLAQVDKRLARISWDATWQGMQAQIETALSRAARPVAQPGRAPASRDFDWVIVGAGFAGSVLAERIARLRGERVLVLDRRPHIAGNAHDRLDDAGVLIHQYGPHIFHTNSHAVVAYLSAFTAWRPYEHRVLAEVDGQRVPVPINLDTVNRLYGLDLSAEELEAWFAARAERIAEPRTSEDVVVGRVGRELYEKFFRGYTRKQWGLDPSELDRSVTARVPVRTNRDDRYFTDTFQAMPRDGYTAMFARMLEHPNITVRLGAACTPAMARALGRRVIWTGPIDEYFGFVHGRLPYRSLRFVHRTLDQEWFLPVATVNYPQTEDFTRVTEYKHLTGQAHPRTSVTYEYPTAEGDPYYPVPRPENAIRYGRYRDMADAAPDTWFVGRLATYQYLNMDQVVGQALAAFRKIEASVPRVRISAMPHHASAAIGA